MITRDIPDCYFNINQNIPIVLNSPELSYEDKERVLNAINNVVYTTIDENCDLPE